jgi:hypothetical protein
MVFDLETDWTSSKLQSNVYHGMLGLLTSPWPSPTLILFSALFARVLGGAISSLVVDYSEFLAFYMALCRSKLGMTRIRPR